MRRDNFGEFAELKRVAGVSAIRYFLNQPFAQQPRRNDTVEFKYGVAIWIKRCNIRLNLRTPWNANNE